MLQIKTKKGLGNTLGAFQTKSSCHPVIFSELSDSVEGREGCVLVQALCQVLNEEARTHDLSSCLAKVAKKVSGQVMSTDAEALQQKQVCACAIHKGLFTQPNMS
jgi:hypothetical protein